MENFIESLKARGYEKEVFLLHNKDKLLHWEFENSNKKLDFIMISIIIFLFLLLSPLVVFVPFGLLGIVSHELSLLIVVLLCLIILFSLGYMYLNYIFHFSNEYRIFSDAAVLTLSILSSNMLLFIFGSPLFPSDQFLPSSITWLDWYFFYLSNIISIITFGISNLVGLVISPITSVGWLGNLLLMLYRGLLVSTLIELITYYLFTIFRRNEFIGTRDEFAIYIRKFKMMNYKITIDSELIPLTKPMTMTLEEFDKSY